MCFSVRRLFRGYLPSLTLDSLKMPFKRGHPDSDYDKSFVPPPKRLKRALSLPPSSPPPVSSDDESHVEQDVETATPDAQPMTPDGEGPMEDMESLERLPALFPSPSLVASGSGQSPGLHSPHRRTQRAESLEPQGSDPMSVVDVAPLKPKTRRGRPPQTPQTRLLWRTVRKFGSSQDSPKKRQYNQALEELEQKATARSAAKEKLAKENAEAKAREKILAEERAAKEAAETQAIIDAENTKRAQEVLRLLTASDADGGFNFNSLEECFDAL